MTDKVLTIRYMETANRIREITKELKGMNQVSQFAKYSKKEREMNKLKAVLEEQSKYSYNTAQQWHLGWVLSIIQLIMWRFLVWESWGVFHIGYFPDGMLPDWVHPLVLVVFVSKVVGMMIK
eukprot:TRINITY_DN2569_c0_g2_i2.p1 TRINITY_DN2569_c0_g2~~TRINITY_DN2569_c0_g2_i2.p1  ORF type:complete len:122 (-),score=26.25 TRINITY_DN2569_c0_g2_i2:10-375(-)